MDTRWVRMLLTRCVRFPVKDPARLQLQEVFDVKYTASMSSRGQTNRKHMPCRCFEKGFWHRCYFKETKFHLESSDWVRIPIYINQKQTGRPPDWKLTDGTNQSKASPLDWGSVLPLFLYILQVSVCIFLFTIRGQQLLSDTVKQF